MLRNLDKNKSAAREIIHISYNAFNPRFDKEIFSIIKNRPTKKSALGEPVNQLSNILCNPVRLINFISGLVMNEKNVVL